LVSFIKIDGRILKGVFQERLNRFLALVKIEGRTLPSFLPNPGRMHELLTTGTDVLLREVLKENRKTNYDLIGVHHNDQMVSIDSRIPNKLVFEALINRNIEELSEYDSIRPEYSHRDSRFDFLLSNRHESCLLEVKSCTLVKNGVALFPDAPTERGRRHLRTLVEAKKRDYRACVLFIVQRTDAQVFSPNDETDPEFGEILRNAYLKGVEVFAYYSEFSETKITLRGKVKVELNSERSIQYKVL
jgi:sugar fermentation stimulation protein A